MLQYLIILLDDTSVSYCHYDVGANESRLIDLDVLKNGIIWAMKENLSVQIVYPDYCIPQEYEGMIDEIDNIKIKPLSNDADVIVLDDWSTKNNVLPENATYIIKATRKELVDNTPTLKDLLKKSDKLNIILSDIVAFQDNDVIEYKSTLDEMVDFLVQLYQEGRKPQLNILTDRLLLEKMNNCDAGDKSITLAPNGKFYICPSFYYSHPAEDMGSVTEGINIKNQQLLRLDHAPLCRLCDAYHCKRCVAQNLQMTQDINTPSHQQCVVSHIERNASKRLYEQLLKNGITIKDAQFIKEIDYLDPFNKYCKWK